jgi:hypothetical protein
LVLKIVALISNLLELISCVVFHVTEEVKLAAVEDKPDGVSLSSTEVVAAAPEPEPEPIPPPSKEPEMAPEKIVVEEEKEEIMTPIIAPQPVTCHETNEVSKNIFIFHKLF